MEIKDARETPEYEKLISLGLKDWTTEKDEKKGLMFFRDDKMTENWKKASEDPKYSEEYKDKIKDFIPRARCGYYLYANGYVRVGAISSGFFEYDPMSIKASMLKKISPDYQLQMEVVIQHFTGVKPKLPRTKEEKSVVIAKQKLMILNWIFSGGIIEMSETRWVVRQMRVKDDPMIIDINSHFYSEQEFAKKFFKKKNFADRLYFLLKTKFKAL